MPNGLSSIKGLPTDLGNNKQEFGIIDKNQRLHTSEDLLLSYPPSQHFIDTYL
jgi:hypothetical protein